MSVTSPRRTPSALAVELWPAAIILLLVWGIIVFIVNPVGSFMVNDDWAFLRTLESLRNEGKLASTGWGPGYAPGGPSLITHLLWGLLFTKVFGFSLTVLRLSVLTLGILASFAMLALLRISGASGRLSLWGTLTLLFNPLFLSQCFTFMTDITFTSYAIFSVLLLHLGVERSRLTLIAAGLFLALCSILTRQIGIVIPLAFIATCLLSSQGKQLGRLRMAFLALGIALLPWLLYELFLSAVGSTPLHRHLVIHNILDFPRSKGLPDYVVYLAGQLLFAASYVGFLTLPILLLRWNEYWNWKTFRIFTILFTAAFVIFELALVVGLINPATGFYPNVIYDFGIGPIVLKDTYILQIPRTATLPKPVFYVIVYGAVLAISALACLLVSSARQLFSHNNTAGRSIGFLPTFALLTGLAYVGIIITTGFNDRYLIPVLALAIVWLVSDMPSRASFSFHSWKSSVPAVAILVMIAAFSVAGVHDFMEMKRSLNQAHHYLLDELKVNPCHVDGGFEFNGYHCWKEGLASGKGNSWWWVEREDYLVTLGPLPGYRIVRTFPFTRYMGPDGAVHILQPVVSPSE